MSGGMCGDVCIQRGIWTVQSQSSPLPQTSIVNILVGANAVVDVAFLKRRGVSVFWGTQISTFQVLWVTVWDYGRSGRGPWTHFDAFLESGVILNGSRTKKEFNLTTILAPRTLKVATHTEK